MNAEQRLIALGIHLSVGSGPAGNYATAVQSGKLLFLSGKAPPPVNGEPPKGRLGSDYSATEGYELARSACIDLLATLKKTLGSLDKVARIVELHGSLCTTPEFEDHAKVLDGASDLLVEVFGPSGLHARSVIGVYSLRNGVPLTLKATIEVETE
ncbi:RidA family protein [Undibacterium rugosum]|uniref:RidA family protein n=1 Tax=Undibacterium rugosum TaxID=2762291 RepID=A0A923I1F5_9BURK|nr:RidA family protein [Undibacterium rugosum]MBC3935297.1 RidA family protein [Undibacterium rugosum]MBR7779889.1 RidA family protein [Undibacterium rugosum]